MNKRRRLAIWFLSACAVTVATLCIIAVLLLRSDWFSNFVRLRTVAAIERATGGRVELRGFRFDWSTLTAEFGDLVVHGTEPARAPPMFETPFIRITFPVTALLRREILIESIRVERPQIYVLVRPDGSTNIPPVQNNSIDVAQLLSLQVGRFAFDNGLLRTDVQQFPLQADGRNLSLVLTYARLPASYQIHVSCGHVRLHSPDRHALDGAVDLKLQLLQNRIDVQQATITAAASYVRAQGEINRFNDPVVDLNMKAGLTARDLTSFLQVTRLSAGEFQLAGNLHYDSAHPLNFAGRLSGEHITYRFAIATLTNAGLASDLRATPAGATLSNVHLHVAEGTLSAKAELADWRAFSLNGTLERGDLQGLYALFLRKNLAWSGLVSGPLTLASAIDGHDFSLHARLNISEGNRSNPVSGSADLEYRYNGNILGLNAHLASAKTRADIAGTLGSAVKVHLETAAANELEPLLAATGHSLTAAKIDLTNSNVTYDGQIAGSLHSPQVSGTLLLGNFGAAGQHWDQAAAQFTASASQIDIASASLLQQKLKVSGRGSAQLSEWTVTSSSKIAIEAAVSGLDIRNTAARYANLRLPVLSGIASGNLRMNGTVDNPSGSGFIHLVSLDAFGEQLNDVQAAFTVNGNVATITSGKVRAAAATIGFNGAYQHQPGDWTQGTLEAHLDSNGFPLHSLSGIARLAPDLSAVAEIHADAAFKISGENITPQAANGRIKFTNIAYRDARFGEATLSAMTHGDVVDGTLASTLRGNPVSGTFTVQLAQGNPLRAEIQTRRLDLGTIADVLHIPYPAGYPNGFVDVKARIEGLLTQLDKLHGNLELDAVGVQPAASASELEIKNDGPIQFEFRDGVARIQRFRLTTRQGQLEVAGKIGYLGERPVDLGVKGQLALQAFELLDPNVTSAGSGTIDARIRGPLLEKTSRLSVDGSLAVHNASFSLKGFSNGLSNVNGVVHFNRDRAAIDSLTGQTGGGNVGVSGFVNFGEGPLVYDLKGEAQNVRLRYAGSVSVTASASLHMAGTSDNGLISGTTSISHIVVSPEADLGALVALAAGREAQSTQRNDLLSGLQFDVRIRNASNMEVSTALGRDIEANLDVRLRGTPGHPLLFGNLSANEGEFRIFGARYSLNRGEITFNNPVRIEPVLNVDVQTITRGVTVDITVGGTLNRLNINYRSDPPLQTKDIIALLTFGQTPGFSPNLPNAQPASSDVTALQAGASSVLGQAISQPQGGLSRLFGTATIRFNPVEQAIINTPQSRLTIEEQISPHATVTYVTNLAQTSEQIFRFEYALTQQYSVVAIRDDNGEFGIDIQYKKRFK
jgi:translocation and assembly module TamB